MALTQVNAGLIDSTSQPNSFKNRIINGDMRIDQRNAGASKTIGSSTTYFLDRWAAWTNLGSGQTIQQSSSAPSGFVNSTIITCGTGATPGSTDYGRFVQNVEGFNTADFNWGTVNAKTVTVSFWVKSSLTGNFGVAFADSANAYTYVASYTINSANTWEYKTVTIPGPTSGSYSSTNGVGLTMGFDLGEGSGRSIAAGSWTSTASSAYGLTGGVKVLATSGATWSVTGVQLEKGSTATSFDYRPYGTELALCQRYYYKILNAGSFGAGYANTSTNALISTPFPVSMRIAPTAVETTGSPGNYSLRVSGGNVACNGGPLFSAAGINDCVTNWQTSGGLTALAGTISWSAVGSAYLAWSAEL